MNVAKRETAILNLRARAINTLREVIIAKYDAILDQSIFIISGAITLIPDVMFNLIQLLLNIIACIHISIIESKNVTHFVALNPIVSLFITHSKKYVWFDCFLNISPIFRVISLITLLR